jgi:hypothetical protein
MTTTTPPPTTNTKIDMSAINVAAILMSRDSKLVFYTCVVLLVILAILIGVNYYVKGDSDGLGQQFEQTDISDSPNGVLMPLNAACAKSDDIVIGLFEEGFEIYSMGSSQDIRGNNFMMSFWKKLSTQGYTVVVTSSFESRNITCVISITKNVRDLQLDGQSVAPSTYTPAENRQMLIF